MLKRNLHSNWYGMVCLWILGISFFWARPLTAQDEKSSDDVAQAAPEGDGEREGDGAAPENATPTVNDAFPDAEPIDTHVPDADGASACIPQCRASFMCHQGACVSLCNPPCPAGHTCSTEGECIAPPPPIASPATHGTQGVMDDAISQRVLARHRMQEEKRQVRLDARKKMRLTIYALGAADDFNDVTTLSGGLQIGLKRHLVRFFAIHGKIALFGGGTVGNYDGVPVGESVISPRAEVAFPFGPFGRFYVGPLLWLQGFILPSEVKYIDDYGFEQQLRNDFTGGVGFEMGVLIGQYEHIDLTFKLKVNDRFDDDLFAELGVGFHIFPWDEK